MTRETLLTSKLPASRERVALALVLPALPSHVLLCSRCVSPFPIISYSAVVPGSSVRSGASSGCAIYEWPLSGQCFVYSTITYSSTIPIQCPRCSFVSVTEDLRLEVAVVLSAAMINCYVLHETGTVDVTTLQASFRPMQKETRHHASCTGSETYSFVPYCM